MNECSAKERKLQFDEFANDELFDPSTKKSSAKEPKPELNVDKIDELYAKDDQSIHNFSQGQSGGEVVFGNNFLDFKSQKKIRKRLHNFQRHNVKGWALQLKRKL